MKGLMLKVKAPYGEWISGFFRIKDKKIVELYCNWYNNYLKDYEHFMRIEKVESSKDKKIRKFKNNHSVDYYENFMEYLKNNS